MMLATQFAAIYRVFAGFLAAMTGSHTRTINYPSLPIELPLRLKFSQEALPQPLPDTASLPFEESAAAGMTGRKIAGGRKRFPGDPSLKNENDPGHHLARVSWLSSRMLNVATLLLRQQWFNTLP